MTGASISLAPDQEISLANGVSGGKRKDRIVVKTEELPSSFRHVRLVLARGKDHLEGDREEGHDLLVPLNHEGFLDPLEWKKSRDACRVR